MQTVTIDIDTLKSIIRDSVREVIREEKLFHQLDQIPYVSEEEMKDIVEIHGEEPEEEDLVDMTDWFNDEN